MADSDERPSDEAGKTAARTDEPLSEEEEAERVFFGTAMRAAPGMRQAGDACRAAMAAAGASEKEINQALLTLARDHVFPLEPEE